MPWKSLCIRIMLIIVLFLKQYMDTFPRDEVVNSKYGFTLIIKTYSG